MSSHVANRASHGHLTIPEAELGLLEAEFGLLAGLLIPSLFKRNVFCLVPAPGFERQSVTIVTEPPSFPVLRQEMPLREKAFHFKGWNAAISHFSCQLDPCNNGWLFLTTHNAWYGRAASSGSCQFTAGKLLGEPLPARANGLTPSKPR